MKAKILLVEDEPNFGAVLKNYLELSKYEVVWCTDGKAGWETFQQASFDLCILDVMMPEKDGFTLAQEIKRMNEQMPLFFLTAKSLKEDVLRGYRIGADDYLTKPFDSEILLEKIKAILKRKAAAQTAKEERKVPSSIGSFQYDYGLRSLSRNGEKRRLSPKENQLLQKLLLHQNQVMPRKEALQEIWGDDNYFTTRSMDVYIAKLRKYLSPDPNIEIINIHGNGFQLMLKEH